MYFRVIATEEAEQVAASNDRARAPLREVL